MAIKHVQGEPWGTTGNRSSFKKKKTQKKKRSLFKKKRTKSLLKKKRTKKGRKGKNQTKKAPKSSILFKTRKTVAKKSGTTF